MELFVIFLDIILGAMLTGVIYYAIKLNRNIAYLQNTKSQFEANLEKFIGSIARAQQALDNIKTHSNQSHRQMQQLVQQMENIKTETLAKMELQNNINYQNFTSQSALNNASLQDAPPPSRGIPRPRPGSQLERVIMQHQMKNGIDSPNIPSKNNLFDELKKIR